jgi:hypothetical protein
MTIQLTYFRSLGNYWCKGTHEAKATSVEGIRQEVKERQRRGGTYPYIFVEAPGHDPFLSIDLSLLRLR